MIPTKSSLYGVLNDVQLNNIVNASIGDGAKCVLGGKAKGCYYMPTLLIDVTEDMSVFRNETFGPVFSIIKAKDINHMVEIANDSDFGLGGSVWSNNEEEAIYIASKIQTGWRPEIQT